MLLNNLLNEGVFWGIFDKKMALNLIPEYPVSPIFHHLPKIHKGLNPLNRGLIIAGIGSINEKLGEWLDNVLQPLVCSLPSYLKDTNHLLSIVNGRVWDDSSLWITCDVSSLYSHERAMEVIALYLERGTHYNAAHRFFVLDVLQYLLTHNFFTFNGDWFLQKV